MENLSRRRRSQSAEKNRRQQRQRFALDFRSNILERKFRISFTTHVNIKEFFLCVKEGRFILFLLEPRSVETLATARGRHAKINNSYFPRSLYESLAGWLLVNQCSFFLCKLFKEQNRKDLWFQNINIFANTAELISAFLLWMICHQDVTLPTYITIRSAHLVVFDGSQPGISLSKRKIYSKSFINNVT